MQLGASVREGEAKAGQRLWRWLPGTFLLLVLLAGFIAALLSPATYELPEAPLLDGAWTRAYEDTFNRGLVFRDFAVHHHTALEYGLFGVGLSGVIVGENGWLFTTEEFLYYEHEAGEMAYKLELVREVQARLADEGAALLIALVPSKARLYEDKLGRYRLPEYTRGRYETFRQLLLASGVPTPDLLSPLQNARHEQMVFLRTDTHWTPYGAKVVAGATADYLQELGLLELSRSSFETTLIQTDTLQGDLLNFLPLGPYQERLGPERDRLLRYETRALGRPEDASEALFGELQIPVTLVGTSYSASGDWHFEGWLEEALGLNVLNAALEGQGPIAPMLRYLDDPAFKESPPELVIWEIPERYLPVPFGPDTP
jgi:alginate O-acetyltransferase complex protein AlgJ